MLQLERSILRVLNVCRKYHMPGTNRRTRATASQCTRSCGTPVCRCNCLSSVLCFSLFGLACIGWYATVHGCIAAAYNHDRSSTQVQQAVQAVSRGRSNSLQMLSAADLHAFTRENGGRYHRTINIALRMISQNGITDRYGRTIKR